MGFTYLTIKIWDFLYGTSRDDIKNDYTEDFPQKHSILVLFFWHSSNYKY